MATKRINWQKRGNKKAKMHTQAFIAVYSVEQEWHMGLLFIKTFPVKQYLYQNDFSGVYDALHQSFLVHVFALDKSENFTADSHSLTSLQNLQSKRMASGLLCSYPATKLALLPF